MHKRPTEDSSVLHQAPLGELHETYLLCVLNERNYFQEQKRKKKIRRREYKKLKKCSVKNNLLQFLVLLGFPLWCF